MWPAWMSTPARRGRRATRARPRRGRASRSPRARPRFRTRSASAVLLFRVSVCGSRVGSVKNMADVSLAFWFFKLLIRLLVTLNPFSQKDSDQFRKRLFSPMSKKTSVCMGRLTKAISQLYRLQSKGDIPFFSVTPFEICNIHTFCIVPN